ncbi:MAG: hypothetical protein ISN28_14830 [Ectothiorhodospiraceae bacterium AqS1]|nr:hypothetical protein [Ectothiorhodospiraceae bacterium AqS1]
MTSQTAEVRDTFSDNTDFGPDEIKAVEKLTKASEGDLSNVIPPTSARLSIAEIKEEKRSDGSGKHDSKRGLFVSRITIKIEKALSLDDLTHTAVAFCYRVESHKFPFPYKYDGLRIARNEAGEYVGFVSISREAAVY